MKIRFLHCLLAFCLSGCATPGGTTFLGTMVGSVVGASVGALADGGPKGRGRTRNIFIGATIGAAIGATTGFFTEPKTDRKNPAPFETLKEPRTDLTAILPNDSAPPILVPPRVDSYFVDDQIRGNVFVPGHMEYQIKEPARWTK